MDPFDDTVAHVIELVAALVGRAIDDLSPDFGVEFYAAAAQIIPVYLVASIGSLVAVERYAPKSDLPGVAMVVLAGGLLLVYAEIVALEALQNRADPPGLAQPAVAFTVYGSPGVALSFIAIANWAHAKVLLPNLRGFGTLIFLIAVAALTILSATGTDISPVFAAAIMAAFFFLLIVGGWSVVKPRKQAPVADDPEGFALVVPGDPVEPGRRKSDN